MGLEIFGKPEKPKEEKALEVIANEESESDKLVITLWDYFEDSLKEKKGSGDYKSSDIEEARIHYLAHLSDSNITPNLIKKFQKRVFNNQEHIKGRSGYLGAFTSAMIQTSFNQGNNDFKFENVDIYYFGAFLWGEKDRKIRIEVDTISSDRALWSAKNIALSAKEIYAHESLCFAKQSSLKAAKIYGNETLYGTQHCDMQVQRLQGNGTLSNAERCTATICDYNGKGFGGINKVSQYTLFGGTTKIDRMRHCTIISPDKEVLKMIKKQLTLHERIINNFKIKREEK